MRWMRETKFDEYVTISINKELFTLARILQISYFTNKNSLTQTQHAPHIFRDITEIACRWFQCGLHSEISSMPLRIYMRARVHLLRDKSSVYLPETFFACEWTTSRVKFISVQVDWENVANWNSLWHGIRSLYKTHFANRTHPYFFLQLTRSDVVLASVILTKTLGNNGNAISQCLPNENASAIVFSGAIKCKSRMKYLARKPHSLEWRLNESTRERERERERQRERGHKSCPKTIIPNRHRGIKCTARYNAAAIDGENRRFSPIH